MVERCPTISEKDIAEIYSFDQLTSHPQIRQLLLETETAYSQYVKVLGGAIKDAEAVFKLEKENAKLTDPEWADSLRMEASEFEGANIEETLASMGATEISTHIYSVPVMHSAYIAISDWAKSNEEKEDSVQSELHALSAKVLKINEKISQNNPFEINKASGWGNPVSIEYLNSLPDMGDVIISPFSAREWELLVMAIQRIQGKRNVEVEEKIAGRQSKIRDNEAIIETTKARIPSWLEQIDAHGSQLSKLVLNLNDVLLRVYKLFNPQLVDGRWTMSYYRDFMRWKEEIIREVDHKIRPFDGTGIDLEGDLGDASGNNHFDVFVTVDDALFTDFIHIQAPLSIRLFLALGSQAYDMTLFQGERRPFGAKGREKGGDFKIPKETGVVVAGVVERIRATLSK